MRKSKKSPSQMWVMTRTLVRSNSRISHGAKDFSSPHTLFTLLRTKVRAPPAVIEALPGWLKNPVGGSLFKAKEQLGLDPINRPPSTGFWGPAAHWLDQFKPKEDL